MNTETFVLLEKFKSPITELIESTKTQANSEVVIDQFINTKLPEIISLAQTVMADGRLDFFELVRVVTFTSRTLQDSLDIYTQANVTEKLTIAREIIQFLIKELIAGDNFVKDYALNDKNLDGLINLVYGLIVKFRR